MAEHWRRFRATLRAWWAVARLYLPVVHTRGWVEEVDAEYEQAVYDTAHARADALQAHTSKRQTERLLVLLSEPLKDWDLLDFPSIAGSDLNQRPTTLSYEHAQHLKRVLEAYQLTAPELARIRMGAKVNDKARQRGWDDTDLAHVGEAFRRVGRAMAINPDRNLP